MPVDILLVRHGQSEWNAEGRWQGQSDPPLTGPGRLQAAAAANAVGAVDGIVSSDLERAAVTAEIIAEAIGVGPVKIDPRLRERHVGVWQGLTREQIDVEWPGVLSDGAFAGGWRPDGWESDEDLLDRIVPALVNIAGAVEEGSALLVVAHSGLAYALEARNGDTFAGRLPNLGGIAIQVDGDQLRLGERVELIEPPDGEFWCGR